MLDFFTDRGIAELSFWWAGVAMPIATVVVILYARAQLAVIANQAQATLLLDLVDKWNSDKMHESIRVWVEIETLAITDIFSKHPGLSDKEVRKKLKEHFKNIMAELQKNGYERYRIMMRTLNFFETVGQLVKRRYITRRYRWTLPRPNIGRRSCLCIAY